MSVGDALCSFNPADGQGMTVAVMDAVELREAVRVGLDGLPRRFSARAAKVVDVAWDVSAGGNRPADRRMAVLNADVAVSRRTPGGTSPWRAGPCRSPTSCGPRNR